MSTDVGKLGTVSGAQTLPSGAVADGEASEAIEPEVLDAAQEGTSQFPDAFVAAASAQVAVYGKDELPLNLFKEIYNTGNTVRSLGEGRQASIFLIERKSDGKLFVARVSNSAAEFDKVKREVRALRNLDHENVAKHYEVYSGDDDFGFPRRILVMEYVEGESLHEHLAGQRTFTEKALIQIGQQIWNGLSHSHEHNIFHRDVKPSNIMLKIDDDGTLRIKVIDFGIAKIGAATTGLTSIGISGKGTPYYKAPEQIPELEIYGHQITAKTDIFSLGLTLLALARGKERANDFRSEDPIAQIKELRGRGAYSKEFLDWIERMVQLDSKKRSVDMGWACHSGPGLKHAGVNSSRNPEVVVSLDPDFRRDDKPLGDDDSHVDDKPLGDDNSHVDDNPIEDDKLDDKPFVNPLTVAQNTTPIALEQWHDSPFLESAWYYLSRPAWWTEAGLATTAANVHYLAPLFMMLSLEAGFTMIFATAVLRSAVLGVAYSFGADVRVLGIKNFSKSKPNLLTTFSPARIKPRWQPPRGIGTDLYAEAVEAAKTYSERNAARWSRIILEAARTTDAETFQKILDTGDKVRNPISHMPDWADSWRWVLTKNKHKFVKLASKSANAARNFFVLWEDTTQDSNLKNIPINWPESDLEKMDHDTICFLVLCGNKNILNWLVHHASSGSFEAMVEIVRLSKDSSPLVSDPALVEALRKIKEPYSTIANQFAGYSITLGFAGKGAQEFVAKTALSFIQMVKDKKGGEYYRRIWDILEDSHYPETQRIVQAASKKKR